MPPIPSVVGRTVHIAGIEFTIVGVAPEYFTGLHPYIREAAFVPLAMWPRVMSLPHVDPLTARDFRNLTVKGRLKPGVTLSEAQAELAAIGKALEQAYPETNDKQALVAQTELEVRFERRPLDSVADCGRHDAVARRPVRRVRQRRRPARQPRAGARARDGAAHGGRRRARRGWSAS